MSTHLTRVRGLSWLTGVAVLTVVWLALAAGAAAPPASAHGTCSLSTGAPFVSGSDVRGTALYTCQFSHAAIQACARVERNVFGVAVVVGSACRQQTSSSSSLTATASGPCSPGLYRTAGIGSAWNQDGVLTHSSQGNSSDATIIC
jgi:hypothetical protein